MVAAQVARGGCPPPLAQHQRAQHQRAGAHLGGQAQHLTAAGTPLLPPALGGGTHLPLVLERCYSATPLSKDVLSQQQQDYYCNVGAAVRALQKDLPALLERAPDLSVYCEGVVFEDNLSPRMGLPSTSCEGKEAFGRLCWSLRFHRTLFFAKSRVELLRMWEREQGVVCVRWSAAASPRLLDGLVARGEAAMSLDGVSEVHFSETGRIMKLTVDCVSYSGPQLLARYAQQRQVLVPGLAGSGSFDE